jgi:alpha-beta hydrolase superfamily lysophospholipase
MATGIVTSIAHAVAFTAATLLWACASPDSAVDPDAEQVRFYTSTNPATIRQEAVFAGSDDEELGYVTHRRIAETALVYLHGIESHAAWFDEAADRLADRGYDVYCLDRRGSGINRENRGFTSGHVDSYETLLADIRTFVEPLRAQYESLFLVGLSWGGKLALSYGLTHPEDCDGLVLITPGLRSLVDVDAGTKLYILAASGLDPTGMVGVPIEPEMFTTTPTFLDKIKRDPLKLHYASTSFFMQSHALDWFIDRNMASNELPILLFLAGQDRIIDNEAVVSVLEHGAQDTLDVIDYEDQTHSIQFDAPQRLVDDMVEWLERRTSTDQDTP